jgi:HSP20 family protein
MSKDLIRLMHTLLMPVAENLQEACWHPAADVYHTPTGWLVKFDLAGVRSEDITVQVQGNHLMIQGQRRDASVGEGCQCYRMEIAYSHFERVLEMPCSLDHAEITAEHRNGMLLIRIKE